MQAEDRRLNGEEFSERIEKNRAWENISRPQALLFDTSTAPDPILDGVKIAAQYQP